MLETVEVVYKSRGQKERTCLIRHLPTKLEAILYRNKLLYDRLRCFERSTDECADAREVIILLRVEFIH